MSLDLGDFALTPAKENSYFPGLPNINSAFSPFTGVVVSWDAVGIGTGVVEVKVVFVLEVASVTLSAAVLTGCHVNLNGVSNCLVEVPKEKAGVVSEEEVASWMDPDTVPDCPNEKDEPVLESALLS